jgi:hypothetical protein
MRRLIFALFATILMVSSANAKSLHNFYGDHPEVRNKAAFITMLKSKLRVSREDYVGLYNAQFGSRIKQVANFNDFVAMIQSDEFEVRPCAAPLVAFGWRGKSFGTVPRGCYGGELLLVDVRTGLQVLSLYCGNILQPPPEQRASACMDLVVKFNEPPPPGIQAKLVYWGDHAVTACGLKLVECVCTSTNGNPPAAEYRAPLIDGQIVRVPRGMVTDLVEFCVEFPGYVTSDGVHPAKLIQHSLAERARSHAKDGSPRVLDPTEWLGFISSS